MLIITCQKAVILAPKIHCMVSLHSTTSEPMVHAGGGARGRNLVHIQKIGFFRESFLDNHLSESIHTCTIDTLYGKLSFHDIGPQCPCCGGGVGNSKFGM